jgi:membrane complex biogenesis BtpA family protein
MTSAAKGGGRDALQRIFGPGRPLIGNVHVAPLPGTPRYKGAPVSEIVDRAVRDAVAYRDGGMDGVLVENHGDIPFLRPDEIGPEVVAAMTRVALAVAHETGFPVGVNMLANHAIGALAVARASGASFVRVNQWANAYVANEGLLDGDAGRTLRYRRLIGAEDVAIFADVHVKHGGHAIIGDRSVAEQARDVEFFDADVAIATGNRTGDSVPDDEIAAIRDGTALPVIGGSGLTPENAAAILSRLDGAIVGSSLKLGGHWSGPVDRGKVEALVGAARALPPRGAVQGSEP